MKINTGKMIRTILGGILTLSLSACGAEPSPIDSPAEVAGTSQTAASTTIAPTVTPLPPTGTPKPAVTPTPVVLADCFVTFHFAAWKDFNEDGLWDASEPPLAGVEFSPPAGFAQIWGYPSLSGADGRAMIDAWSPGGCPERDVTITATPPESYEPATPASITLSLTSIDSSYEVQFGFRAVSR